MKIQPNTYFKGQIENIVFVGKIVDTFQKKFVVLDIVQLSPQKINEAGVTWPYKSFVDLKNLKKITKEQFDCMKSIVNDVQK